MSTDTPQTWADMARELQAANARLREERDENARWRQNLADKLHDTERELAEAKREREFDSAAWARDNERLKQSEARALEYKTEHAALLGTSQWQEVEIADLRDDVKRLMQTVSECEERALAAEKDAGRLRDGVVIGKYHADVKHTGRAWWSGGIWLNKGEEIVVVDAAIAGAKHASDT